MIYLFVLILLTSCSSTFRGTVNSVVFKEIKSFPKEDHLKVFGYGGELSDGIRAIKIVLTSRQTVDIAEARRMIVRYIERIRNAVNSEEGLQEYLIPYPFPVSGIKLGIMFVDENDEFIKYGCVWLGTGGVSVVSQQNGRLNYGSYNPRTTFLEDYYSETYEEALAIVEQEQQNECD